MYSENLESKYKLIITNTFAMLSFSNIAAWNFRYLKFENSTEIAEQNLRYAKFTSNKWKSERKEKKEKIW